METITQLYQTLLEAYTEQVKGLENKKKETQKQHHIEWIPHVVLNSRMFTYDEYLTNVYHGGFCYEEKNNVMPHLVNFLAVYEKSSDEEKTTFENLKPKNEYQQYLDELYIGKGAFIAFLESQLKELQNKESNCRYPSRPQRSNATRQLAKYREDKEKYDEDIESINRCRKEINERIELFNELLKKY